MAAPTVYNNVAEDAGLQGQLFAGKKFWVAQRVPSRTRFLDQIRNNGGEVVMLEKKADYMIADHFRRDCPAGSISYTFIEESLKQGEIQDAQKHPAGPPAGTAREAGSSSKPTKGARAAYTAEEDRILYKWVRDCEANGGLASGNEIYKQLEAQHPRHTWQSWRDRYLKQLRDRPPSAFNIPDNAPPSPPTDEPAEPTPLPKKEKQSEPKNEAPAANNVSGASSARSARAKKEYTVDDFDKLFDTEDWKELYAFVDEITDCGDEASHGAWDAWSEGRTQSAEQWRQYFEKVVRPQWEQDPTWKRKKIKREIEKKHKEKESQGESSGKSPQVWLSSSTAVHETPKYITEAYKKALKRVREGNYGEEAADTPRQAKRQKSESVSPAPEESAVVELPRKTQEQPIELTSGDSSTTESQLPEAEDMEDLIQTALQNQQTLEELENTAKIPHSDLGIDELEAIAPPKDLEPLDSSDYPSNTPTPRAPRHKAPAFDTQAILSSPSQGASLSALPLPGGFTQVLELEELRGESPALRSSSPGNEPESEASTTHSLQEYRRSLNGEDNSLTATAPLPHLDRSSSAPSSPTSTDSEDPDPPLEPSEVDIFYDKQHDEGFTNDFISTALKRTRCRPDLAEEVLIAWRQGQPLPCKRGIWGKEDDEDVESGDGVALARLEKKHTCDGWGGITERMRFLEQIRQREQAARK